MCTITLTAQQSGCKIVGGAYSLYLIDKAARLASSVDYAITDGAVEITGNGAAAYRIIPRENNITINQAASDENTNGTSFVTQTIEINMSGYSAAKVALFDQLRRGRLEILAEYLNGEYVLFGTDSYGMQSNGGDGGFSGTAKGDAMGQTYSFSCESRETAPLVTFSEFQAAFTINEPA